MRIPGEDRRADGRPSSSSAPSAGIRRKEILERNKEKAKQLSRMLDLVRARVEWMAQRRWRMAGESQEARQADSWSSYGSMPGGLPSG